MKKMIYERRTSIQLQKDIKAAGDFTITYQGFGGRRSDIVPQAFAILTINNISYIEKNDAWREKYPYSDATFKGKTLDLCIHTDCPEDWYSNKGEKQFLRMDAVSEEDPLTIFWNVKNFEILSMIQGSVTMTDRLGINLSLDTKESYFMDLDRKLCHEIRISSITLDYSKL